MSDILHRRSTGGETSTFREFSKHRSERLTKLARRVDDLFERLEQRSGFPVMLEPVADFFSSRVVSDDVGCAKLGEMAADRLHGAAGEFGKTTRRGRSALVQENDELVDHRIAQ